MVSNKREAVISKSRVLGILRHSKIFLTRPLNHKILQYFEGSSEGLMAEKRQLHQLAGKKG